MTRAYQIPGECLVNARFGAHLNGNPANSGTGVSGEYELGLCVESVVVTPIFHHQDVKVNDYGPTVPIDVLAQLGEMNVRMTLVHYDPAVLDACWQEAVGGGGAIGPTLPQVGLDGEDFQLVGAGTPLGNNIPVGMSGCHFVSLHIREAQTPFRSFLLPAAFLDRPPVEMPQGTERTQVVCNWRSLPYNPPGTIAVSFSPVNGGGTYLTIVTAGEPLSSGAVLFTHTLT